jgi:hypothetical protein
MTVFRGNNITVTQNFKTAQICAIKSGHCSRKQMTKFIVFVSYMNKNVNIRRVQAGLYVLCGTLFLLRIICCWEILVTADTNLFSFFSGNTLFSVIKYEVNWIGWEIVSVMNGIADAANKVCFRSGAELCYCKDFHNTEGASWFPRVLLNVHRIDRNVYDKRYRPSFGLY